MKLTKEDFSELGLVNVDLYLYWLNLYCEQFKLNTVNRLLCFLPNLMHESNNFKNVREILPKNNPEYIKKLGSYYGKGLLQITHLFNYKAFTNWCKVNIKGFKEDFVKNPELLETPQWAVLSAFWFWKVNNLEKWADENNFRAVCSIINTGKPNSAVINGWEDRLKKQKVVETWLKKLING